MTRALLRKGQSLFCIRLLSADGDIHDDGLLLTIRLRKGGKLMKPDHIRIRRKHLSNRRAALVQDILLQRSVQGFGAVIRIHRHVVQQYVPAVLYGSFLLQGTSQDRDILYAIGRVKGKRKFPPAVPAQPEQTVCSGFGKRCAAAVCMQQHHAQTAVRDCRHQCGRRIPHPFVKDGRHIRLCDQPSAFRHADAVKKRCGIHPLKAGVHIRIQQLAGRGQPPCGKQLPHIRKRPCAIRAEQLRVTDENAASLCRFTITDGVGGSFSFGRKRFFLAEGLCVERQLPSALQP